MWKQCLLDGKEFLIKQTRNNSLLKLHVTDLVTLCYEEIEEDSLLQRCKEMNKLVEASDEVLLNLVWSLIEGAGDDVVISFSENVSGKQLNLQSNLDGLKFRIKFVLTQADQMQFFREVTCPLLITISDLEKRQKLLMDIIKKKDLEIAEYKLEGAKISRKAVETKAFDQETFSSRCSEDLGVTKGSVEVHPSHAFTPLVQQLLANIAATSGIMPIEKHKQLEELSHNSKKKSPLKMRSPVKAKKSKMYSDDEEEEDTDEQQYTKKEGEKELTESVNDKELEIKKVKLRPKIHKALSNL